MVKVLTQVPPSAKPAAKPAAKVKPKAPAKTLKKAEEVNVVPETKTYEEVILKKAWGKDAITVDMAKEMLGWEDEESYFIRCTGELSEEERATAKEGWELPAEFNVILTDDQGRKITCWYNSTNRPFTLSHASSIAQDILNRNWAGPLSMEGDTVNGETVVIGWYGHVLSGQHRLIGLVIAGMLWASQEKWKKKWETEPVLETIVVCGVSESARVIRTLDNVRPRSETDVFYTSDLFKGMEGPQKKEASRMLAQAVDLFWERTGQSYNAGTDTRFKTHSESIDIVDRHPKLLECLKEIFDNNQERQIASLPIYGGVATAVMYLMAASKSDGDQYRNMDKPGEAGVDFENWDRAYEFWVLIAGKAVEVKAIREAFGTLLGDSGSASGGARKVEKLLVLAKAWDLFLKNEDITEEALALAYTKDSHNNMVLSPEELADFGGIDLGRKVNKNADTSTDEEVKENIQTAASSKLAVIQQRIAAAKAAKANGAAGTDEANLGDPEEKEEEEKELQTIEEGDVGEMPAEITEEMPDGGVPPAPAPKKTPTFDTTKPTTATRSGFKFAKSAGEQAKEAEAAQAAKTAPKPAAAKVPAKPAAKAPAAPAKPSPIKRK